MTGPAVDRKRARLDRWPAASIVTARTDHLKTGPTAGFLTIAPKCDACGLDFAFADAGDGPAVFVSLFAGFLVLGAALWTEFTFSPPYWLLLVIFLPLTAITCMGMLRPLKGLMVGLQWRNKAGEQRDD